MKDQLKGLHPICQKYKQPIQFRCANKHYSIESNNIHVPTQGCKHQGKLMKTKITIFSCSTTKFWGIHKNDVRTGQVNLPLSSTEKQENVLSHPMMKIEYGATCKLDKVIAREEDPLIFTLNSEPFTVLNTGCLFPSSEISAIFSFSFPQHHSHLKYKNYLLHMQTK
jgi:hypothetical protein